MMIQQQKITAENTIFVQLCFEGPDQYSLAGGLGTRVVGMSEALALRGFHTHLIFIGDPYKPAVEISMDGCLVLKRWSQWISRSYPGGVYDGEEQKMQDYAQSVPAHVCHDIVRPAVAQGKFVVILGEEWHTAETTCRISDLLFQLGLREHVLMLWNISGLMSVERIDWERLHFTSTLCTISKYMKHKLWDLGYNALVIPCGLPTRALEPVDTEAANRLRAIIQRDDAERLFLFKMGRFDPAKRWIMAVEATVRLKELGHAATLVVRGGVEPYGAEVIEHARQRGLTIVDLFAPRPDLEQCLQLLADAPPADVYNLHFFLPNHLARIFYRAADATLANSIHEPFGLVALEVMAARGIAVTGATGEDYAIPFENALVVETDDPDELVSYLLYLQENPEERQRLSANGYHTAQQFLWDREIANLLLKLDYLARKWNTQPAPIAARNGHAQQQIGFNGLRMIARERVLL